MFPESVTKVSKISPNEEKVVIVDEVDPSAEIDYTDLDTKN